MFNFIMIAVAVAVGNYLSRTPWKEVGKKFANGTKSIAERIPSFVEGEDDAV